MKTKSKVKEFTTCKECKKSGWFTLSTNWQCPHCREQSLEQYPTSKIHVVDANQYHGEKVGLIEKLLYVEQMAWNTEGSEISASTKKIANRVNLTPECTTLAYLESGNQIQPVGSQFCFRFDWDGDVQKLTSWDELTSNGNIEKVHKKNGKTGFLVGVGVVPEYRKKHYHHNLDLHGKHRVSELLINFVTRSLFEKGVKKIVGNARVPFYHKKSELSIFNYCKLRNPDGLLFDPVLRFHEKMGAKIIKPVEYSMEDKESLNAGCWVCYSCP